MFKTSAKPVPRLTIEHYHADAELQMVDVDGLLIEGFDVEDTVTIMEALFALPEKADVPDEIEEKTG